MVKLIQITLVENNKLTAHLDNDQIQNKFIKLLNENEDDYFVEIFKLENLKKISEFHMAKKVYFLISGLNENDINEEINLKNFNNLEEITTGEIIYKHLVLPENLKKIIFCNDFNYELNNLPSGLKILDLEFCNKFDCDLNNLPMGLKELYLNANYSKPLDYLPESLKLLKFECVNEYKYNFDNLPNGLEEIKISSYFIDKINKLPYNLKKLHVKINNINRHKYYFNSNNDERKSLLMNISNEVKNKILKIKNNNLIDIYIDDRIYMNTN